MFRWLAVPIVFVLCLFLMNNTADAQKKKKKKAGFAGAVVSIEKGKDNVLGILTVKTPEKKNKKKGTVTPAKEHKVQVTKDTLVVKATGKKKEPPAPATFADIQVGTKVNVTINPDKTGVAERVLIQAGKKKKKKNQ